MVSGFGSAIAINGNDLVIGASKDENSSSAYVFHRHGDTWSQQAKLLPDDLEMNDDFGFAVAVSEDTVVIGVHKDDDMGIDSGSAYVFTRYGDTWSQEAKLLPSDGQTNDHFGHAVGVYQNMIAVGAPYDDDNGTDSGSVYVFIRDNDTWKQRAKVLPKDGQSGDYFGKAGRCSKSCCSK